MRISLVQLRVHLLFAILTKSHILGFNVSIPISFFVEIFLADALCGFTCYIQHLDNSWLKITNTDIISPDKKIKKIIGLGMPIYNPSSPVFIDDIQDSKTTTTTTETSSPLHSSSSSCSSSSSSLTYGDLFIEFNIRFPDRIDPQEQEKLRPLLHSFSPSVSDIPPPTTDKSIRQVSLVPVESVSSSSSSSSSTPSSSSSSSASSSSSSTSTSSSSFPHGGSSFTPQTQCHIQ